MLRLMRLPLACIFLLLAVVGANAVQPDEILDDPTLEARARNISQNLRCLVCQNQSIDDSNADLARDLRVIVRQRLVAGDSDDEVLQFVVDRYGDYVLLSPPLRGATFPLWFGPIIILVVAGGALLFAARRRRSAGAAQHLSEQEQSRLSELLDDEPKRD